MFVNGPIDTPMTTMRTVSLVRLGSSIVVIAAYCVLSLHMLGAAESGRPDDPSGLRSSTLCGPHSLYVMLKLSGVSARYEAVMKYCPTHPDGMSLLELTEASRAFGFQTDVRRCTWSDLADLSFPAIVSVKISSREKARHYLVIVRWVGDKLEMIEPTTGQFIQHSASSLDSVWDGYVLASVGHVSNNTLMLITMAVAVVALLTAAGKEWQIRKRSALDSGQSRVPAIDTETTGRIAEC
jgi:predicted double-glycine peptidase